MIFANIYFINDNVDKIFNNPEYIVVIYYIKLYIIYYI